MALAAGIDLPDDLALWQLAAGRPVVEPAAGHPEELGDLLEASIDCSDRKARGAHFTPTALAREVVARALADRPRATVCDPACGGGALLLAAARHLAERGADPAEVVTRLWGIDVDPLAVATTEAALAIWSGTRPPSGHLVVADALLDPPSLPAMDVVVGNPPFLGQLSSATSRSRRDAARLRGRFGAVVRAYTDTAVLFLLAGCDLAAPDGVVVMVQPQSVLAARDAAGARSALERRGVLREVWVPDGQPFDAAVDVCVPVLDLGPSTLGATRPSRGAWSAHLARVHGVPSVQLAGTSTVGDEAVTAAAFRSEYYGIAPHVHEAEALPHGRPLLTTGLVDLGGHSWGGRAARVAGRRWERPVVDVESLEGRAADWAQRTAVPKLVIAGQTSVVEALVDPDGRFLPGVPLVVAVAPRARLWALAAALCSPPITAWAAQLTAGSGLTSRAIKLSASLVRQVPLPDDLDGWRAGAVAFEQRDLPGFAAAMTEAYGCDAAVAAWWLDRVGSVWSVPGRSR